MKTTLLKNAITLLSKNDDSKTVDPKKQLHQIDYQFKRLLLWSNIGVIFSYLLVIGVIVRIYQIYSGNNPAFFISCLVIVYLLLSVYLFVVGKDMAYQGCHMRPSTRHYLIVQVAKLNKKLKVVAIYLLLYALLLCVATLFFVLDIRNGLTLLFKVLTPVSVLIYGGGLYFMFGLSQQKNKLGLLDKQLDHISVMEQIRLN